MLDASRVPRSEQKLFTDRIQYPKFELKPVVRDNNKFNDSHSDMNYWGSVEQLASHTLNIATASSKDSARIFVRNLAASFETAELHTERLNEDLIAEAYGPSQAAAL